MVKGGALLALLRASAAVQSESRTQEIKKITASHAVNFLSTSAVEAPNKIPRFRLQRVLQALCFCSLV